MSKIIRGYKLSSSNSSASQKSTLFVKAGRLTLVRMQSDKCSNLLSVIRRDPKAPERQAFVSECMAAGIAAGDVQALLSGE